MGEVLVLLNPGSSGFLRGTMQIFDNLAVWSSPVDEGALRQIKTCYYIFGRGAMMADHHKGYAVRSAG